MKHFKYSAAQGDLLLVKIEALPHPMKSVEAEHGQLVLAHSETGHHHCLQDSENVTLYERGDRFLRYLEVTGDTPVVLEHQRVFDTHEALEIQPGVYEVRRQREYHGDGGFRPASD